MKHLIPALLFSLVSPALAQNIPKEMQRNSRTPAPRTIAGPLGTRAVLGLAAAGFVSCAGGLRFDAPRERLEVTAPASWTSAASGTDGRISSGWLGEFGDPALTRAVEDALAHNQDLMAASARMRQAKESSIASKAGRESCPRQRSSQAISFELG